jgi:hypothetical protein
MCTGRWPFVGASTPGGNKESAGISLGATRGDWTGSWLVGMLLVEVLAVTNTFNRLAPLGLLRTVIGPAPLPGERQQPQHDACRNRASP